MSYCVVKKTYLIEWLTLMDNCVVLFYAQGTVKYQNILIKLYNKIVK